MRRATTKAVDELGLTLAKYWEYRKGDGKALPECTAVLLVYLARQPGGSALLVDAEEQLHLSDWEKGRGCQRIARAGLLRITRESKDGRAKRLTLTANGHRAIDRLTA